MKVRNISPLGHVDVPLLRRQGEPFDEVGRGCLQPGEEIDVTEDQARQLLPQRGNFEAVDAEAMGVYQQLVLADDQLHEEREFPGTGESNSGVQVLPGQEVEIVSEGIDD